MSASATSPRAGVEMLRVTDLHAFYGESHILHGIDFQLARGAPEAAPAGTIG